MSSNLKLVAYRDTSGSSLGSFELQLNPTKITVTRSTDNTKEDTDSDGNPVTKDASTFQPAKYTIKFTLDDSGAIDHLKLPGNNISESMQILEKYTIIPDNESHQNPYVYLQWGKTFESTYFGQVSALKYDYTFFDLDGNPLRVEVTMSITEVDSSFDSNLRNFNSPDITRIPTIKDKDNLVKFSIESYDDKKYYIRIAELNNLSSVRDLENGKKLFLPPLKK